MIVEITNPLLIPKILDLAKNIPNTPIGVLRHMLEEGFTSKDSKLLASYKGDIMTGFLYATVETFNGEDAVFIQSTYIDPDDKNSGNELMAEIRKWAAIKATDYLYMMTQRDSKAFMRKYKFEYVTTVMRRKV